MHKLIIEDDEGKTVVVPLIRDEITVGRQEGNTVRLTEQNISRRHARFVREEGVLFVEDLQSYNGIKINGALIADKTALKDGDQILIGDYKLGLKIDEAVGRTMAYGAGATRARPGIRSDIPPATVPLPYAAPSTGSEEIIEGAPTIPVRTLADRGLDSGGQPRVPPARLVVMSTQLAGAEFLLDRASLVIGRTAENDVILNHKSISRHHAKIIRDGERYVVVDLESANGVRVNGTQQERMILDSGDVIELGHVRLKFLAGDDVLGSAGLGGFGGSRKSLYVGVGVALAVVAVAVLFLSGDDKPKPRVATEKATTAPAVAPEATPTPTPAAPQQPAEAVAPEAPNSAPAAIESVRQMVAQSQWDQAMAAVSALPADVQSQPDVVQLRRQIVNERTAEAMIAQLQADAEAGRLEAARKAAGAVPADSRYAPQAATLLEKAQSGYVAARMNVAEGHRAAGRCGDARKEADRILKQVPGESSALALIDACAKPAKKAPAAEPVVVAQAPRKPARPAAAPATPAAAPKPKAPEEDPMPTGDPDQYIAEAQDAWTKGQHAAAIAASRKALRLRPGLMRAYQIIAVCSCSLRDQPAATKAYERLDDKNKQLVRALCDRNGITLAE